MHIQTRLPHILVWSQYSAVHASSLFPRLSLVSLHFYLYETMAANYWASTQRRHWQFSREALAEIRQKLDNEDTSLVQQYPLPDRRLLSIFFNQREHSSVYYPGNILIYRS